MSESPYYKGMPKSVRIGCFKFRIEVGSKIEHESTFGWNSFDDQVISMAPSNTPAVIANTFLHEVLHGIHWNQGLMRHPNDPQPSEEEYTRQTANGLCAFWQDNPEAMKWWLKVLSVK